jgi:excinuclease ABC subunit C
LLDNALKTASLKETPRDTSLNDLAALEETLNLAIKTIEGYDVSNLMGRDGYVAQVVFKDGKSSKKDYRVFKTNQDKPDDYLALKNALKKRAAQGNPPDLILIDGGKGQLSVAQAALKDFILKEKIIAIAKKEETVFGLNGAIKMTPDALRLLINVRDEAHRFSLKHHRKARSKKMTASALEGIPGLGTKRIKKIEESIPDLASATAEDFERIKGISSNMALQIHKALSER